MDMDNTNEIRDALNFDPFAELEAQRSAPQQEEQQGNQEPNGQGANAQEPAPTLVDRTRQPPREQAPRVTGQQPQHGGQAPVADPNAQQQPNPVAQLMETMGRVGGMPSAAPQQPVHQRQEPQPRQEPQQNQFDYSQPYKQHPVQIPQELKAAIFGQDLNQANAAFDNIISTIYNSLRQEMHVRFGHMSHQVSQMPGQIHEGTQLRNQQQQLADKFYGKFGELNTDIGRMAVMRIAENVAQVYTNAGREFDPLSDDFINYVGLEAKKALNLPVAPPAAPPAPPRQRKPQFQTLGPARAGEGSANPFMEALGFGPSR